MPGTPIQSTLESNSGQSTDINRKSSEDAPNAPARSPARGCWRSKLRTAAPDFLIFLGFICITALMTWPWILHLRDAVGDRGDPYMIAWTLWWDYHQTFHDPLHLFNANIFFPYQYTLAFSENDYGIAVLFFPLFALGLRPLTVHSIATFLGFAFSAYGAFRLTRTLTNSTGAGWIAGIVFAFIPFRFTVLSHLHYMFAGWMPLLLEALVLFARQRTQKRAAWLGVAFLMNALTCLSWFIMTTVPLGLTVLLLLIANPDVRRDRKFWLRGAASMVISSLALLPFLIPYYVVSVKYGLHWQPWEFAFNSARPIHWLAVEARNHVWHSFGNGIPGGIRLFPGMLAPLLAVAAFRFRRVHWQPVGGSIYSKLVVALDVVAVLSGFIFVLALGYEDAKYRIFGLQILRLNQRSATHALTVLGLTLAVRLLVAPVLLSRVSSKREVAEPDLSRDESARDYDTLLITRCALPIGLLWVVWGFSSSLGANVFINRLLHDYLLPFQSIRIPWRAAMICYVGLAVLAGVGAQRLALKISLWMPRAHTANVIFCLLAAAVIFELHASPLQFERGEVEPSQLALRLKQTPMKGGLVEMPSEEGANRHFYMLRAADHERPLVNATSSFLSPLTEKINAITRGPVPTTFIDTLEQIPTSYLVIHNERMTDGRRAEFDRFLSNAIRSGRLVFINRYDNGADLYAVARVEPDARSEAPLPFTLPEEIR
jgi:hypothetical protein